MVIPYRIHQIKTQQFAIFPERLVNQSQVLIKSDFSFGVNKELTNIKCNTKISYTQDENLLLIIEVTCLFDIDKDASKQLLEAGRIEVDFLRYLATITTGTIRGIIHTKTEGTSLNLIVLPPINLMDAIKNDFIFK